MSIDTNKIFQETDICFYCFPAEKKAIGQKPHGGSICDEPGNGRRPGCVKWGAPRHGTVILICRADLNPIRGSEQDGLRPVLVLSHDVFNQRSGTVIATAITGQKPRAQFPLTLEIRSAKLPKRSWIKISQVRTLATERLGRKLGRISPEELTKVMEGLVELVDD